MVDLLFGALAFLALLGWGVTNAITSRNHLREANALETAMRIDAVITEKATDLFNRYIALKEKKAVAPGEVPKPVPNADENAAEQERRRQSLTYAEVGANGEGTIEYPTGIGEQPLDAVE